MEILKLIKGFKDNGINITLQGDNLKVNYSGDKLPDVIISQLKDNKEEIINFLKQEHISENIDIPVIDQQSGYHLSSSQSRLWLLSQFEDGNVAYNMLGNYVFEGKLNTIALDYAFKSLIERHEILRTVFSDETGDVRQVIKTPDEFIFNIDYFDLSEEDQKEEQLRILIEQDSIQPFNLATGPLLRAGVFQLEADKWVLSYVMHHIIGDGWSMNVLIKELLLFYNSYLQGEENPLEPLRIQYKDYATWQQQQVNDQAILNHKNYWLNQLSGELPLLELPVDRIRPVVKTYNGGSISKIIPIELTQGLKTLVNESGGTLFMGLLTMVNALLYRYTQQEDIIIGTPIAGREHTDLENQIGFYLNTLALRTRFKGEDNFNQLLDRVKEVTLGGYEHQIYPFDELINDLDPQQGMSRSAMFDVMIVLQNTQASGEIQQQQLIDLSVNEYSIGEYTVSKFELTFNFTEKAEGLQIVLEYNKDIFNEETINRLASHFVQLLEAVIAQPTKAIQHLYYLSKEEEQALLIDFNKTSAIDTTNNTILDLFENSVAIMPEAIALQFGELTLSYSELNNYANQLGSYLRDKYKITPDDLIGISLPHSEWVIIAILGVLKSGGAYVPIDPNYHQDHADFILKDSGCKILLDDEALGLFRLERENYSSHNLEGVNKSEDLTYVIYTSGSTGRPKGCAMTHRNLLNYIEWANDYYFEKNEIANFSLYTSLSFDLTVTSIFCTLTRGGKLVVYLQQTDISEILKLNFSGDNDVNSIKLTPSHINLLKYLNLISPTMKIAIVGGEEVTTEHIRILKNINPHIEIYNEYGPTESTVGCVVDRLEESKPVVIGKPIANSSILILDKNMALCPIGVVGEICIGGAGLARGYLNQLELTAERFVTDPFNFGERLFRSGDLGRWSANGEISFHGRNDDQVKIRGYRIELNGIEAKLKEHPLISAAVAVVRVHPERGNELVAYIVGDEMMNAVDLQFYLSQSLPIYMLPDYFVQLDKLPLTINGKINKNMLPDAEGVAMKTGIAYVAPRNETDEKLVEIWRKILGREHFGIKDNFFSLGGNSVKLVKMVSMINSTFDQKMTIVRAFRLTTIQDISDHFSSSMIDKVEVSDMDARTSVDAMNDTFKSLNNVLND